MAYCKLYYNFAAVFNKLKLNIMKTDNLKKLSYNQLVDMHWQLKTMLETNDKFDFLNNSETTVIQNWLKEIRKSI